MWWMYTLVGVLALIAGVALGFFIARKYMMDYLKKNPPINENMLRVMMMQMGQKPSQKKINQMMKAMNSQMTNNDKQRNGTLLAECFLYGVNLVDGSNWCDGMIDQTIKNQEVFT